MRGNQALTRDQIEELRRLHEAATPGEWSTDGFSITNWRDNTFEMEWIPNGQDDEEGINANANNDAAAIVALHNAAPSLLADASQLADACDQAERDRARIVELERERDAYKRAKAENDERFMNERAAALARVRDLETALAERLAHKITCRSTFKHALAGPCSCGAIDRALAHRHETDGDAHE